MRKPTPLKRYQIEYELYLKNTVSWKSYYNYSKVLEQFSLLFPKAKHPNDIGMFEAAIWKTFLEKKQLAKTTIELRCATLRAFFSWLVDKGYAVQNPFSLKAKQLQDFV